jgi:hypothetical protein
MGDKNPVLHKNLVLSAGSFRRLDGSMGQGGRVEKRREHGWPYASRDEAEIQSSLFHLYLQRPIHVLFFTQARLLMTVVDTSVSERCAFSVMTFVKSPLRTSLINA